MIKTEAVSCLRRLLAAAELLPNEVRVLGFHGDLDELHIANDGRPSVDALFIDHQIIHDGKRSQHQRADFFGIRITRVVPKDGFFEAEE